MRAVVFIALLLAAVCAAQSNPRAPKTAICAPFSKKRPVRSSSSGNQEAPGEISIPSRAKMERSLVKAAIETRT
jgi:hypothetical protein